MVNMVEQSPTVYMLIGVPGSGKSTYIRTNKMLKGLPVVSSDTYIEAYAKLSEKTYDEVFEKAIGPATDYVNSALEHCIKNNKSFIWDQTNLSRSSRRRKLAMIPRHWQKIAVVFKMPHKDELERRLANRAGKTIPKDIMSKMIDQFEPPNASEGFDRILTIQT